MGNRLAFYLLAFVFLSSCGSTPNIPKLDVKLWDFDLEKQVIVHKKTKEEISFRDNELKYYTAISADDVHEIIEALLSCKQLKDGVEPMTVEEKIYYVKLIRNKQKSLGIR